jgi:hypothetical protein
VYLRSYINEIRGASQWKKHGREVMQHELDRPYKTFELKATRSRVKDHDEVSTHCHECDMCVFGFDV